MAAVRRKPGEKKTTHKPLPAHHPVARRAKTRATKRAKRGRR